MGEKFRTVVVVLMVGVEDQLRRNMKELSGVMAMLYILLQVWVIKVSLKTQI